MREASAQVANHAHTCSFWKLERTWALAEQQVLEKKSRRKSSTPYDVTR